jgi:hypothetical protein
MTIIALLPEGKLFDAVYDDALRPAAEAAGLAITRVASEFSGDSALGAFCSELEKSDLAVADVTGRNPNIFYQIGYAHALGKKVLLISRHGEDFPFNKAKHPAIIYSGDVPFLKKEFASYLENGGEIASTSQVPGESTVTLEPRDRFEHLFGDILAAHKHQHHGSVEMENANTFVLVDQDMELALVQDLARRAREIGVRLKLK